MEMKYNVTGNDRKRLVTAIAEFMECAATYKGAPTFAYEVGCFTIDKNGTVSFDDRNPQRAGSADSEKIEKLIQRLHELGFEAETEEAVDSLILSYPREDITDAALENLRLLVASKETLIKKALAVDALPIEVDDEKVSFPWFEGSPTPEEISAYTHFTSKLISMAKTQKRVIAKEKETENDKYAFRCFLLRLGFIGDEYKAARKILLKNLTGSGAFKSGNPKVQEMVKRINADADLYDDVMSLQNKEETEISVQRNCGAYPQAVSGRRPCGACQNGRSAGAPCRHKGYRARRGRHRQRDGCMGQRERSFSRLWCGRLQGGERA